MKTFDLTITQGDDVPFDVAVSRDGVALDLTGSSLWFTVKTAASQTDAQAVAQLTLGDGITLVDAEAGTCTVLLERAVTEEMTVGTTYLADLQIKDAAGLIATAAIGTLKLTRQVTINAA